MLWFGSVLVATSALTKCREVYMNNTIEPPNKLDMMLEQLISLVVYVLQHVLLLQYSSRQGLPILPLEQSVN